MSAILNSLNAHNFPIFQLILMKLVSKSMIYRALAYKVYSSLGLRSPLSPQEVDIHLSFEVQKNYQAFLVAKSGHLAVSSDFNVHWWWLIYHLVVVQPGLCQTWLETPMTGFLK